MTTSEMDAEAVERLRQSLFRRFKRRLAEELQAMDRNNTKHFHKVLAQWLSLEREVHRSRCANPFESDDPHVQSACEKLTAPENAQSLESLFYQLSDPRQIELATEALRRCRERGNPKSKVGY